MICFIRLFTCFRALFCLLFLFAPSCNKSNTNKDDVTNNDTKLWIVSTTPKRIVLPNISKTLYGWESSAYAVFDGGVIIFSDYNNMYRLYLCNGDICILHLYRIDGRYSYRADDKRNPASAHIIVHLQQSTTLHFNHPTDIPLCLLC